MTVVSAQDRYLCVDPQDRVLLRWVDAATARAFGADVARRVSLDGTPGSMWAVRAPLLGGQELHGGKLHSPREVDYGSPEAAVVYRAVALVRHRDRYRFDPVDGTALRYVDTGDYAVGASGREVYPRIDPAVIGIVEHTESGRILVARNAQRPEYFSLIAGYVAAGETLEEAFVREVWEETGRRVVDISYVASQPWPTSSSLMVGFRGVSIDVEACGPTDGELVEIRWVAADQVLSGQVPLAPVGSLAHRMMVSWASARSAV